MIADNHGNAFHVWERNYTMQRRHQKLIEESPRPLPRSGDPHGDVQTRPSTLIHRRIRDLAGA